MNRPRFSLPHLHPRELTDPHHLAVVTRRALRVAKARLRRHGPSLLLAALAAVVAYAIASWLFRATDAFFAPVAAVICAGIAPGQRIHRALEIAVGVAVGLTAADLLIGVIGNGVLQLGLAVALAMGVIIVFGGSPLLVNQSAVAAVLIVALVPEGGSDPIVRFFDALIGGTVALALGALLAPEPQRQLRRAAQQPLEDLLGALGCITTALRSADSTQADRAISYTRRADESLLELRQVLDAARERARLGRHRSRAHLRGPAPLIHDRLGTLAETSRTLARAASNAVRHGESVDESLIAAIIQLASALRDTQRWVTGEGSGEEAQNSALAAAVTGSKLLEETHPLAVQVAIGQVRAGAVDLMHVTGLDRREATESLEQMAGRADVADSGESAGASGPEDTPESE